MHPKPSRSVHKKQIQIQKAIALEMLPSELLVAIFSQLPIRELLRVSVTCRDFHDLVMQTAELRYRVELSAGGYIDGPPGKLGPGDRLRLLIERRARWRSLAWRTRETIQPPLGYPNRKEPHDAKNFLFSHSTSPDSVHKLSSVAIAAACLQHDAQRFQMTIDGHAIVFSRFIADASQDLLILIEQRLPTADLTAHAVASDVTSGVVLHLRSLSSGGEEPHPRCAVAILFYHFDSSYSERQSPPSLQLAEETVCVVGDDVYSDRVLVWNWVTGRLHADIDTHTLPFGMRNCCLVSPQELLFTHDSIIPSGYDIDNRIYLFSLSDPFPGATEWEAASGLRHVLSLALPKLSTGVGLITKVHTGPFTTRSTDDAEHAFAVDPLARLHVLRMEAYNGRLHSSAEFLLFFLHGTLVRLAETYGSRAMESGMQPENRPEVPVVPWAEWGPDNTRLLAERIDAARREWCSRAMWISGARAVCSMLHQSTPTGGVRMAAHVLDFRYHAMSHEPLEGQSKSNCLPHEARTVTEPTTINMPDIFAKVVVTDLPYRCVTLDEPVQDGPFKSGWMLDEERLYRATPRLLSQHLYPGWELEVSTF